MQQNVRGHEPRGLDHTVLENDSLLAQAAALRSPSSIWKKDAATSTHDAVPGNGVRPLERGQDPRHRARAADGTAGQNGGATDGAVGRDATTRNASHQSANDISRGRGFVHLGGAATLRHRLQRGSGVGVGVGRTGPAGTTMRSGAAEPEVVNSSSPFATGATGLVRVRPICVGASRT